MAQTSQVSFMGVKLHPLTMSQTISHIHEEVHGGRVVTAVSLNVAKLINLRHDPDLKRDLASASLVLADGMGVVWGARLLGVAIPERVAGVDLMDSMLASCADEGWTPYFLGARSDVLECAVATARRRHPALVVAGWQHGYYEADELSKIVDVIRKSGATCLFVGMPSPKKEQFLARHGVELGVPFMMGVGGGLDILAGVTARAPRVWREHGMEWLYRVLQEPRRMWWRYFRTNTIFAVLLAVSVARHWLNKMGAGGLPAEQASVMCDAGAPAPGVAPAPVLRCRKIAIPDLPEVALLLQRGFPNRPKEWFAKALTSLSLHNPPPGYPQFGYALDCDEEIVGALLVIVSATHATGHDRIRRNASCWYVEPAFRLYAPLLIDHGSRRCEATDVNVSPARHTWPILEAQGFKRFSDGLFAGVPLLSLRRSQAMALTWARAKTAGWPITEAQSTILEEHEAFGCFSLVCRDELGVAIFVFRERRFLRMKLRGAQVIFCEQPADFKRFGLVIGSQLLLQGYVWFAVNTNRSLDGIAGLWFPGRAPMYYRGADKPASGDLLYTEAALFGF